MTTKSTQSQLVKKLVLKKQRVRLLTPQHRQQLAAGPTAIDCSVTC